MNDIAARKAELLAKYGAPKGLSREAAAYRVGVSPSLFDQMVDDGRMPKPKKINTLPRWDRDALDLAFEALPDEDQSTGEWDRACGLPSRTGRG